MRVFKTNYLFFLLETQIIETSVIHLSCQDSQWLSHCLIKYFIINNNIIMKYTQEKKYYFQQQNETFHTNTLFILKIYNVMNLYRIKSISIMNYRVSYKFIL